MHIAIAFVIAMCLFARFHPIVSSPTSEMGIDIGVNQSMIVKENIKPLSEIQNQNIVKQSYDYSCGSAALATLLKYHLGENLTERQVLRGMMEYGNKANIAERRAFSLLDMKKFVEKLGYQGIGYKAEFNDLLELKEPCILPIQFSGYRHFTVLKGFRNGHVFLADPFRGNTSYTIDEFSKMWYENIIFLVQSKGTRELTALKLTNDDLRFISEDSIDDLISEYGPDFRPIDERDLNFTLPDEYQKYKN